MDNTGLFGEHADSIRIAIGIYKLLTKHLNRPLTLETSVPLLSFINLAVHTFKKITGIMFLLAKV